MKIIAEIAQGFEGNARQAELLAMGAIRAGADAVKYQLIYADEISVPDYEYYEFFKTLEMGEDIWENIAELVHNHQKCLYFDIYGEKSLQLAKKLGAAGVKISTADFYNLSLILKALDTFETVLLSIGGIPIEDIDKLIENISSYNNFILMYGFQSEPTNIEDNHLSRMANLNSRYQNVPFGFMDHSLGTSEEAFYLPLMALGMGITCIEKHITLDCLLKIEDYISALEPQNFKKFVEMIKKIEKALGNSDLSLTEKEIEYRKKAAKAVIAKRDLLPGETIFEQDLELKRVGAKHKDAIFTGFSQVIGKTVKLPIKMNSPLTKDMLESKRKLVAALACRVQSSRLYAKPLQNLDVENNTTILDYLLNWLKDVACIDEIVLGISEGQENHVFIEYAEQNNLSYIIGDEQDVACIDEIVLGISEGQENHVFIEYAEQNNLSYIIGDEQDVLMRLIKCGQKCGATDIFRVTTESPFTYYEAIETAWLEHLTGNYDATFLDHVPDGSGFEIIKLDALEFSHFHGSERHRSELCSLYIRENRDQFSIREINAPKILKRLDIRLTVDYPEDLILCRAIFSHFKDKYTKIPLHEIIHFLDQNPQLKSLVQPYIANGLKTMYL